MAESDDEDVLFSSSRSLTSQQGKGLLGNRVKTIDDIMNGPKEDRRLKKTMALCFSFLALGLSIAVLGPTLLALQKHVAVDFPKMSYVFIGRSIGYLAGSVLGGVMFDWFNTSVLLGCVLFISGLGLIVAPFCSNLWSLAAVISAVGVAMGALDTGANVFCLRLWGKRSPPFLQALHFSFAVGAFISPLLASPFIETTALVPPELVPPEGVPSSGPIGTTFLSTNTVSPVATTFGIATLNISTAPPTLESTTASTTANTIASTTANTTPTTTTLPSTTNTSINSNRTKRDDQLDNVINSTDEHVTSTDEESTSEPEIQHSGGTQVQNVYIIIGIVTILISFSFFYFFCTSPPKSQHKSRNDDTDETYNDFKNTILFLMFIFYFLYVGAEIGFGGYIFSFAKFSKLHFDVSKASLLNAAFFGAIAIGRGLSICLAGVLSARMMLVLDITGCILSSLFLATYGESIGVVLWVGTIFLGLSMASLFPSGISWLESYCKVTGNMASILIVGSALGEMSFPMLIGWMFRKDPSKEGFAEPGPMGLMYVTLAASGLTAIIFAILQYLAKQNRVEYKPPPESQNAVEDMLQGVQEAFVMEELGSKKTVKQTTKKVIPKPLQIKKHRE